MEDNKNQNELTHIPKKDIFATPKDYFEHLSDRIMDRIDAEEAKKTREGRVLPIWRYMGYAAAACVSLLAIVWIGGRDEQMLKSAEELLAEVDTNELVLYLQNSELDTEDIIEAAYAANLSLQHTEGLMPMDLEGADVEMLYENYGVSKDENLQF